MPFMAFAKVDDTLAGVPGDTITVPAYAYIGDADIVACLLYTSFLPLCAEAPKRPVTAEKQEDFDGKKALRTSPGAKQQPHP